VIIQNAPHDPLSDVLSAVGVQARCSVRLQAGGDWAIRFRPPELKFNAVRRGGCWLVPDDAAPRRLQAGDCFVVVRRDFVLASDPTLLAVNASEIFGVLDGLTRYGEGTDVDILGGSVALLDPGAADLVDLLPPVLVITKDEAAAAPVAWMLDQLECEWRSGLPGGQAAANDLLRLMFTHVLRIHLARDGTGQMGWLAGLKDPPVAAALRAIHADPDRVWRLPELAAIAGLSRSGFAERFRGRVGQAPIDYAARWRMMLAGRRLARSGETISSVAASMGFLSDSAFGAAFRRVHGVSPGRYRAGRVKASSETRSAPH